MKIFYPHRITIISSNRQVVRVGYFSRFGISRNDENLNSHDSAFPEMNSRDIEQILRQPVNNPKISVKTKNSKKYDFIFFI